jgi:FAD/FMN-containing dehydrogenase
MSTISVAPIRGFAGEQLRPGDSGYDEARSIWNAMIDKRPALIAFCTDADDVVAAVRHAREHELEIAVRSGGHSVPGHSLCDGGIVIDLSRMHGVEVDPVARRVRCDGGCLLGAVDDATARHGMVVPAGAISHTGLGGLVLGGGTGWLMRRFGLSIDNLLAAEVVTAEGDLIRASDDEHPELFWALRGGGGNFGIVTSFEFRAHEFAKVFMGVGVFPIAEARPALRRWSEVMADAPDELTWFTFLRRAPEHLPFLSADTVGKPILLAPILWLGDVDEGERQVTTLLRSLEPPESAAMVTPFVDLQKSWDEIYAHGRQNYHMAGYFDELGDDVIDVLVDRTERLPSPVSTIEMLYYGGAVARVPSSATAFPHRERKFPFNIIGCWDWVSADDNERQIAWVKETYAALRPHMAAGAYVNHMGGGEPDGAAAAYGPGLERLRAVKGRYDPDNVLHLNSNIAPPKAAPA